MARDHDIFISYARKDRERARVLARVFERQGWRPWWDPEIAPGEPFDKVIKRALDGTKVVVVLWTHNSVDSDWVLAEADEGKKRKVLVPVQLDPVEIPLGFRRVQAADLVGWNGEAEHAELRKLLDKIAALLGSSPSESALRQAEATPATRPEPRWRRHRRPLRLAAAAAAAIVLAAAAYFGRELYDDLRFERLIVAAEAHIATKTFADAERSLDRAGRLRPDDPRLLRARRRWSDEWRRHHGDSYSPGGVLPVQDCPECPQLVEIPAGAFMMGSPTSETPGYDDERPQRTVRIARPFLIGRYEVTVGQFGAFVRKSGHKPVPACARYKIDRGWDPDNPDPNVTWEWPDFSIGDDHPVVCVSWHDAKAYVQWLSRHSGKTYRLPSESEWEYAARAGAEGPFYWSADERVCDHANIADSTTRGFPLPQNWRRFACPDGHVNTAPVGRYPPNKFGLYDMLGNAWEWVEDCYNPSYTGAPGDGRPWLTGDCDQRVMRGAAWISQVRDVRIAQRGRNVAKVGYYATGFRVVREK